MGRTIWRGLLLSGTLVFLAIGCQQGEPQKQNATGGETKYVLDAEPAGAKGVIETRKNAKDKDEVVVVGRIGGDKNPWIKDLAAFSIVDKSCTPCNEIEDDTCPHPWDYCCEVDLGKKTASIRIVDAQGKMVKRGAKELLNVKELDTVVVQGVAKRDDKGNLTVLAKGVYVRK